MNQETAIRNIPYGHVQGIAADRDKKYMYYSFTTALYKTDMQGNIIGSVKNLIGHLGCIAFCEEDGRLYGSLEFKNDSIGHNILKKAGVEERVQDGFYIAVFDADKINRPDMDAQSDQVMTAVFLKEVLEDYSFPNHRYGCSGIDGITFAPLPGDPAGKNGRKYIYVAYGIYSDLQRTDNDYQILLCYDAQTLRPYELPLNQKEPHHSGPQKPKEKYFVYTGNTTFGVQNLEYDSYTNRIFMAVYKGHKQLYPNYPMFAVDLNKKPCQKMLKGIGYTGDELSLAKGSDFDEKTGISGYKFEYGSCGMISLGDGKFFFSRPFSQNGLYGTDIGLYFLEIHGKQEEFIEVVR